MVVLKELEKAEQIDVPQFITELSLSLSLSLFTCLTNKIYNYLVVKMKYIVLKINIKIFKSHWFLSFI